MFEEQLDNNIVNIIGVNPRGWGHNQPDFWVAEGDREISMKHYHIL